MRVTCVFAFLIAAACGTRANPDVCCVTDQQCSALGIDEPRPCEEPGQVCKASECVAFECNTSVDCPSTSPICIDHLCVGVCTVNADCANLANAPYCAEDGACVGCLSDNQCQASTPVCDRADRACRPCARDSECSSGVCVEAEGTCAELSQLIYVTEGGVDTGTCPSTAPCGTINFAQGLVSPTRRVIRILGGQLGLGGSTIALYSGPIIDGSDTNLVGSALPMFLVANAATLEGVRIVSTSFANTVVSITAGGALKLANSTIDTAEVRVMAGSVTLSNVHLINGRLDCTNANATVTRSTLDRSSLEAENGISKVSASHLGPTRTGGGSVIRTDGLFTIENNVFFDRVSGTAAIAAFSFDPGSTIRFNTFINTATSNSGSAIVCADGLDVTSNIFAANSAIPIMPCVARHSLFDAAGAGSASNGVGNVAGETATFFKDGPNKDYHLSATSPAIGIGEPNIVTTDFDGHPRPAPAGSKPDVGAFEAP